MKNSNTPLNHPRKAQGLLVISFIAFISLGLPDGLLGVAWPGIRNHFDLPVDALGIILSAATGGYMLSSFFSGVLMRRIGIGGLLSLSCAVTASALLVFATTPVWWLFILFAAVVGVGGGAIDAGINTFVATYHSKHTMQWLHASFGVGVTLGPVIMTMGISMTSHWQPGYVVVAVAQGVLAAIFLMTKGLWQEVTLTSEAEHRGGQQASLVETITTLPAQLSMLMFFLYTGVEVGLGLWAYSLLTGSRGVSPEVAGILTGSYWAMFTVGRVLAGWYTRKIEVRKLIYLSLSLAIFGVGLILVNAGQLFTVVGIAVAGFAVAPIFPGLVSDTGRRVGRRHQANTIGMQIAAAGLGSAVVPSLAGVLADRYGLEVIPLYLLLALALLLSCFALLRTRGEQPQKAPMM